MLVGLNGFDTICFCCLFHALVGGLMVAFDAGKKFRWSSVRCQLRHIKNGSNAKGVGDKKHFFSLPGLLVACCFLVLRVNRLELSVAFGEFGNKYSNTFLALGNLVALFLPIRV